jgi:hypothetical protein
MGVPRGGPAGGFNRRDSMPPNFGGRGAGPPGGMGMAPPGMMMGRGGACRLFHCCGSALNISQPLMHWR